MKRLIAACALTVLMTGLPLATVAAAPTVTVIHTAPATLQVGDTFALTASAPVSGERYLLTLTVVDLETGGNVDLEGWIPGSVGQTVSGKPDEQTVTWTGKAGRAGRYRLYVTAVPLDHADLMSSSSPSELTVTPAPAPYTAPLMAVSVGEPVVAALAIGWILRRRRER